MRRLAPIVLGAVLTAGCARDRYAEANPDGATLLGRSHGAEETLFYKTCELNEQVLTGAWPLKGSAARSSDMRSSDMLMYGRPIVTMVERTQFGPRQKRYEVIATNAPGARVSGMVVTQNGGGGWRYIPAARRLDILTFPTAEVGAVGWLALVLSNYKVLDIRRDRMAGVPAWHLRLQPMHPDRPVKRMWLDADTYLPLRQELWGPEGRLLSSTQVTRRPEMIAADAEAVLEPPLITGDGGVRIVQGDQDWLMPEDELHAALGYPLGRIGYMPPGFIVAGSYLYLCPDALGASARWELTDGVATVNVIQTQAKIRALDSLDSPQDIQGPIETVQRGPFHFIVRGNLPASELQRIAGGITLEEEGQP